MLSIKSGKVHGMLRSEVEELLLFKIPRFGCALEICRKAMGNGGERKLGK